MHAGPAVSKKLWSVLHVAFGDSRFDDSARVVLMRRDMIDNVDNWLEELQSIFLVPSMPILIMLQSLMCTCINNVPISNVWDKINDAQNGSRKP